MANKVKKLFGDFPESIAVLTEVAEFDETGIAEVSDEAFEIFKAVPGYEIVAVIAEEQDTIPPDQENEEDKQETSEEDPKIAEEVVKEVAKATPAKKNPPPKKPAPGKR